MGVVVDFPSSGRKGRSSIGEVPGLTRDDFEQMVRGYANSPDKLRRLRAIAATARNPDVRTFLYEVIQRCDDIRAAGTD
jgi:hypothetical protein